MCLLFNSGDDVWTKSGVADLRKHLQQKIKKHEGSAKHKVSTFNFKLLGATNIVNSFSSAYADAVRSHNETVRKNRDIISAIINILKLCGKCNLPLRGHDESSDSRYKGVFLEVIDLCKETNPTLKNHFENATVFKGTSKTIQNELMDCMLQVCREYILKQLESSSFLACIVDVQQKYQMLYRL